MWDDVLWGFDKFDKPEHGNLKGPEGMGSLGRAWDCEPAVVELNTSSSNEQWALTQVLMGGDNQDDGHCGARQWALISDGYPCQCSVPDR